MNRPEEIAITEKTSRMPIEMIETTIANLKEMLGAGRVEPDEDDVEDHPPDPRPAIEKPSSSLVIASA